LAFARAASDGDRLLDSYEHERRRVARRVLILTHLAFWAEADSGPLAALLRDVLAPLGAPAVPSIIRRRRLVAEVVRCVSQLRFGYPHSPISEEDLRRRQVPSAGRWLRDGTVTADGRRVQLHALLAQPGVHVLLEREALLVDRPTLGPYVHIHRLESTAGTGVTVVRPDGYVGFRGNTVNLERLHAWLRRIGAVPAAAGVLAAQASAAVGG
jgi:hypothetical protein